MFKRVITAVGNPLRYLALAAPISVCYYLTDTYLFYPRGDVSANAQVVLMWAYRLLLFPLLLAGIYGALNERLRQPSELHSGGYLQNGTRYYWRLAGANLLFNVLYAFASLLILAVSRLPIERADLTISIASAALAPVALFWFAGLVIEGGLFKSLGRGLKLLVANPFGLAIGLIWALVCFADGALGPKLADPSLVALRAGDAAILGGARVICTVYLIALYRQVRAEPLQAQEAVVPSPEAAQAEGSRGLIGASFAFAFASFVPLVHIVALVLGILAIRRNKRFVVRSGIAIAAGAFFTVFYAYLVAAWFIWAGVPSRDVGYRFLAEANPSLGPSVALIEDGSYKEAIAQLQPMSTGSAGQDWTLHSALAIARWSDNDLDGALESFYAAAQKKPERAEFYYYYGLALLDKDQPQQAIAQFHNASLQDPAFELGDRYAELVDTSYTAPQAVSIPFTIIILLILFTVHEYGHALAASKLGDDTARLQGRLTLSPIAHLDLFGSIILPGILLWRGSDIVFGWAKPVPVDPANFKDPRRDHVRVAFAGPAVNLLVAMLCFAFLGGLALLLRLFWPDTLSLNLASPFGATALSGPPFAHEIVIGVIFIKQLMYTSLALGFFNLLPVPPLDGSWILSGLLPERASQVFEQVRRFGFVLFLLIAWTPVVDYFVQVPVVAIWLGLRLVLSTAGLS